MAVLAGVLLGGCVRRDQPATENYIPPVIQVGDQNWVPLDIAMPGIGCLRVQDSHGAFQFLQGTMEFAHNQQWFNMLNQRIWLGYPCMTLNDSLYIHQNDWQHSIMPIINRIPIFDVKRGVVVLDAGHGGRDTGARAPDGSINEKFITLEIVLHLKTLLEAKGWRVALTRDSDMTLDLEPRVARSTELKPDFFISIHVNAAGASEAQGIETFYTTPSGLPSNLTRTFEDPMDADYPANEWDNVSYQLAWTLQRYLLLKTRAADRGVKTARFMGVLRHQTCPAILVETGFLTNEDEHQRLATVQYRQLLAEGIASAFPDRRSL